MGQERKQEHHLAGYWSIESIEVIRLKIYTSKKKLIMLADKLDMERKESKMIPVFWAWTTGWMLILLEEERRLEGKANLRFCSDISCFGCKLSWEAEVYGRNRFVKRESRVRSRLFIIWLIMTAKRKGNKYISRRKKFLLVLISQGRNFYRCYSAGIL